MTRNARLKAYAKLNLGLRVLYKRPDGYHELRTVFQTISLADQLDIAFTPTTQTRVEILGTPEITDNLVEKAARLALEAMSIHADVIFRLKKRIPSGAGLGGGSSDAAAVLLALPVLAGIPIQEPKLSSIAVQLGSDVPFFLHGGTALGLGRGEELYPLPELRGVQALVVVPDIHSSTAEAYRDLSQTLTSNPLQNKLASFQQHLWTGPDAPGVDENDFEPVVFTRHPELAEIRDRLIHLGAKQAMMTGSGSALFAIFENQALLDVAKRAFGKQKVFAVSFLTRARYRSAWKRSLKPHLVREDNHDQWPPRSLYEL
jgi:4-diphosphocytidyl-2-C-methyl-D-erythritol kinase